MNVFAFTLILLLYTSFLFSSNNEPNKDRIDTPEKIYIICTFCRVRNQKLVTSSLPDKKATNISRTAKFKPKFPTL